ncbi:MAG TPA: DNA polymerase III subunit delta, partial [Accumulibacter sp.]|nr:DNA polymerase III subunit delta [Accumulibacter sp.]
MLLKGDQLAAHLERELLPVYLVHGDDPLLVIEAADAIRLAARQRGYDERELLAVTANFNWNDLYHAAANLSLFGGRKVLDLRLPTGKPGRDGSAALQRYCSRCSPDCLLLVSTSQLDWKEEKAAWVGALANAGAMIKLFAPKLGELPAWIAGRLRRQRQSAEAEGLRFIAERVEGNLLAAHQEILKLGVLYPPGTLHIEQIRAAVLNVAGCGFGAAHVVEDGRGCVRGGGHDPADGGVGVSVGCAAAQAVLDVRSDDRHYCVSSAKAAQTRQRSWGWMPRWWSANRVRPACI